MKKLFEIAKAYMPARHMISAVLIAAIAAGVAVAQNVDNYTEQGGSVTKIGGTLDIISGGLFKIAGTTVSSSAAELNYLDITTLGTGAASKAIVLDASGDWTAPSTFTFVVPSSGSFTMNSGSTFAVATTASLTGDVTGDGGDQLHGFLQNQVATTTTTLTAAQCGTTFVAAAAAVPVLPEASTVLGCRYTFVSNTADDVDIDPADGTDVIGPIAVDGAAITPAAGDEVRMTDVGTTLTLEAVGANLWAAISHEGPITDVN